MNSKTLYAILAPPNPPIMNPDVKRDQPFEFKKSTPPFFVTSLFSDSEKRTAP